MRKGEAFITKAAVGITLLGMFTVFVAVFMSSLSTDYGRTIESQYDNPYADITSDVSAIQVEAQQIQKSSGIDAQSTDLAQAQGVLSAAEKAADTQSILMETLTTFRNILPFDDFVLYSLIAILSIVFLGAIAYIPLGRWF